MDDKKLILTDEQLALSKALTVLQFNFVVNLLAGMSKIQAIKKAGSSAKTDNSLHNSASKCLAKPAVSAFYGAMRLTRLTDSILTRDEGLVILSRNARVSMTDIADYRFVKVGESEDGDPIMQTVWTMKNSDDIDPDVIACIKSVTMTKQGPKVELHDQQGAIKQISELQGWAAPKRTEVSGIDGEAILITHIERKII